VVEAVDIMMRQIPPPWARRSQVGRACGRSKYLCPGGGVPTIPPTGLMISTLAINALKGES